MSPQHPSRDGFWSHAGWLSDCFSRLVSRPLGEACVTGGGNWQCGGVTAQQGESNCADAERKLSVEPSRLNLTQRSNICQDETMGNSSETTWSRLIFLPPYVPGTQCQWGIYVISTRLVWTSNLICMHQACTQVLGTAKANVWRGTCSMQTWKGSRVRVLQHISL